MDFDPRCTVCGKAQTESVIGGDGKRKRQAVNHIHCANSAQDALTRLRARHCFHCANAYTNCPRRIELTDGWGPMDIECCSEWTPRPTEGGDRG